MIALTKGFVPVRDSLAADTVDTGAPPAQIPMSQQNMLGGHGYDMHPQEFVRLSGCQELKLRREKRRTLLLS